MECCLFQGNKLLIKDQTVVDCESFVFTHTSYNQYFQLTMQGKMNVQLDTFDCLKLKEIVPIHLDRFEGLYLTISFYSSY